MRAAHSDGRGVPSGQGGADGRSRRLSDFHPIDVDLRRSPLRRSLDAPTHVLGAFNPGLARLPGGNLLMMVRVAEALSEPVLDGHVRAIRWTPDGYVLDRHPLTGVNMTDPRQFSLRHARTGCSR